MNESDEDDLATYAEELPTWWCDNQQVLRDLVSVTLAELTDLDLERLDDDTWLLEIERHRCLVSVLDVDRGIEVTSPLAYDVPCRPESLATVLRFNQGGSPARHWLTESHHLMTTVRVSAHPFVGAHLLEAIQIVFGASAEAHHAAAACGGVPAQPAGHTYDELQ